MAVIETPSAESGIPITRRTEMALTGKGERSRLRGTKSFCKSSAFLPNSLSLAHVRVHETFCVVQPLVQVSVRGINVSENKVSVPCRTSSVTRLNCTGKWML